MKSEKKIIDFSIIFRVWEKRDNKIKWFFVHRKRIHARAHAHRHARAINHDRLMTTS